MSTMIKMVRSFAAVAAVAIATPVFAAGNAPHIERQQWSFSGPFGFYDRGQLQRGFRVYREVCASCHGLKQVAFRNLAEFGGPSFTEDQAKQIASEYTVVDGPNDDGDMYERPGILADKFPSPFPNEQAARASNGGAYPPDFSLLAKARAAHRGFPWFVFDAFTQYQEQGPDYIYALLTSYPEENPACLGEDFTGNFNPAFLGGSVTAEACAHEHLTGGPIGMAAPLSDELVEYTDGTPMTVDQYARDVSAFMMWAAEPHLEERKKIGFRVMIFLIVFAGMLYFTKKKLWRNVEH
ncbi:Cytochrome b/c1 [Labrenzia sp. THAF191b]|jgi:cytochrome c1|uniref:cytochrome c1 n=1 Tax=unclassified Labrenzia TaxID=2648686 RepID=UPI0012685051|nr:MULTISPECIES: cytochrome c1 [unclassified Labrenzia]QFS98422.1 Cytochrome b/c1 [Labrenzia sp. THAF191b]QFT04736.1 Cytochrome b/c1 [Labrenzia sp. THAF191a]QFT16280.1 Cytochrome b/c1 [Labrenzia sp. THAF187b]